MVLRPQIVPALHARIDDIAQHLHLLGHGQITRALFAQGVVERFEERIEQGLGGVQRLFAAAVVRGDGAQGVDDKADMKGEQLEARADGVLYAVIEIKDRAPCLLDAGDIELLADIFYRFRLDQGLEAILQRGQGKRHVNCPFARSWRPAVKRCFGHARVNFLTGRGLLSALCLP